MDDFNTAVYVRDRMREYGWEADLVQYDVELMYPTVDPQRPYAELTATFPGASQPFRARLAEQVYPEDPLSASGKWTQTDCLGPDFLSCAR